MKKLIFFLLAVVLIFALEYIIRPSDTMSSEERRLYKQEFSSPPRKESPKGVITFVLTEVNDRAIEGRATFKVNIPRNQFELKVDGETFLYTPTGRVGDDPLCGITATDKYGRSTAICVEIINQSNVKIRVWNSSQRFKFKAYSVN